MKFFTRSALLFLALYGLLFAVANACLWHARAPMWIGILFAIGMVGLQFLIAPVYIQWLLRIKWDDDLSRLPARNREFLQRLCAERGVQMPRIGIIDSGTPNAFTFGRTPSDARIVVTAGLLEVLTPEESNAVLAHEFGHVLHWDFVVMTVAALAPLLLYQIYVFGREIRDEVKPVAYASYICYWFSQYLVLMLNRTREYYADSFAAQATRSPAALSSALVKISCGLVQADAASRARTKHGSDAEKSQARREVRMGGAMALMGISNLKSGAGLVLAQANPSEAAAIMRWDMVNPWARIYEMSSTHPLTAMRVQNLNREAAALHQACEYPLDGLRIHWGRFPIEFALWAVPWFCGAAAFAAMAFPRFRPDLAPAPTLAPSLLIVAGLFWLLRTLYRFRWPFQPATIKSLLADTEVSEIRTRAVRLEGETAGLGVPGAYWCADLVLRDSTGLLFLLYEGFPMASSFFGWGGAESYVGLKVVVEGWYCRGVRPYLQLSTIRTDTGVHDATYVHWWRYMASVLAIAAGALWLYLVTRA